MAVWLRRRAWDPKVPGSNPGDCSGRYHYKNREATTHQETIWGNIIAPSFCDQYGKADMRNSRTDLVSSVKISGSSLGGHNMRQPQKGKRHHSSSCYHRNTWENLMVPITKERVDETDFNYTRTKETGK